MHRLLSLLRLIHRELYLLGPGIVPAVLSRYRSECAWLITLLCGVTALVDLLRRRWVGGLLWFATASVLFAAFQSDARLWGTSTTLMLGWISIFLAVAAVIEALVQELWISLASARRERRAYRRIQPGVPVTRRRD